MLADVGEDLIESGEGIQLTAVRAVGSEARPRWLALGARRPEPVGRSKGLSGTRYRRIQNTRLYSMKSSSAASPFNRPSPDFLNDN